MRLKQNQRGVSLVELVLTISLITAVAVTLSIAFPKAAQSTAAVQKRIVASNLAESQIQIVKNTPYSYTGVTTVIAAVVADCNCAAIPDVTVLASTATTIGGTAYHTAACVHYVTPVANAQWTSQCAGDSGYKHIVVYAYWTAGNQTYSTSQETMLTRI